MRRRLCGKLHDGRSQLFALSIDSHLLSRIAIFVYFTRSFGGGVHERVRRTDRRTPHDGIGRACIPMRGKHLFFWTSISLRRVLSSLRPSGVNMVPPDRGKLVTLIAGSGGVR